MRNIQFQEKAYQEFVEWAEKDFDIFLKIDRFIKDISRDPFKGLGKPEPLKYQYKGFWSRRINDEHRLVYTVTDKEIIVVACRYHYRG